MQHLQKYRNIEKIITTKTRITIKTNSAKRKRTTIGAIKKPQKQKQ